MKLDDSVQKVVIIVFLLFGMLKAHAQADPQYTQYMYNTIQVNPAYAGSRGVLSVFGMNRTQWIGLDGAPNTTSLSLQTPLGNSRLGLGFSFVNDRIGAMDENNVSVDLSYTIDISAQFKLSFGLKGTANLLNVDYEKLSIYHQSDPVFAQNINNQFSPNIGAGLYLHSQKSYMGISIPNFLEIDRYDDSIYATMKQRKNLYFIGGHVFDLSPSVQFKPAVMAKVISGAPLQLDVSANFLLIEKVVLGAAYRWDAAVSGLVGFQISDGLFVGYSYDAETTQLARYNSGSHEIFLRFELFNRFNRITSPRFF